jgi:hypothetical protein
MPIATVARGVTADIRGTKMLRFTPVTSMRASNPTLSTKVAAHMIVGDKAVNPAVRGMSPTAAICEITAQVNRVKIPGDIHAMLRSVGWGIAPHS